MANSYYIPGFGWSYEFPKERAIWGGMITRCYNPNRKCFKNYGGRGIRVCLRWKKSFKNFLIDMGHRPSKKHSLERINNNWHYNPQNCRWAIQKEQCRNKRNNKKIAINGETKCLSEWAENFNISMKLVWARIETLGWNVEKALATPAKSYVETFTHNGITKSVFEWAKDFGLDHRLIHQRRTRDGWTLEEALFTPIGKKRLQSKQ